MKYLFLLASLVGCFTISAQVSLGGQINVYGQLLGQAPCTNTITVTNALDFTPGMGLIIVQMSGANINLSNTSSYGEITDFNGAGRYEYNRVTSVDGNVLTLEFSLNTDYVTNNTQVVGFQIYEEASVDNNLTPASWDGSIGGVIALEVLGTLTLNANLDASGSGFRGGAPIALEDNNCNFLTNANNYAYEADNWRGAPKGEGIGLASSSAPFGRGAQANGGGGGNDHNSGGGGGSLLSAGGQGGRNNEPSTFGCDGDFPGLGGKILSNDSTLAFLGGGGGSGHANNNTLSGGGHGGGIIFLKAGSINFSGGQILSNGLNANNLSGDGGGGGGAGGTIILITNNLTGDVQLIATGGAGATVNNSNDDRCFGPGGGGSGGVLWSNLGPAANLLGGTAGLSTNSSSCPESSNEAQSGATGLSGELLALPQGEPFAVPTLMSLSVDTTVCSGELLVLEAIPSGSDFTLQWQRLVDGSWSDLVESPGVFTGTQSAQLQIQTTAPSAGSYRLRLIPNGDCFAVIESAPILVNILPLPAASPSFTTNGTTVTFAANTVAGDNWNWSFLPGQGSTEENPIFTFPEPGVYPVSLSVMNACGTTNYELTVTITEPLIAQIGSSSTEGCAPLTVNFADLSTGNIETRLWEFSGGDPTTSDNANPVVTFTEAGSYEVTLSISNGSANANSSIQITVVDPPLPSFEVLANDLMISLQNSSLNASSYLWNFGDGNTSTLENPVHTYATPGIYEVSLSASNNLCGVAIAQTVNVNVTAVNTPSDFPLILSPNPTRGWVNIEHWKKGYLQLYSPAGQQLQIWKTIASGIDLSRYPTGIYFLQFVDGANQYWVTIVKQ